MAGEAFVGVAIFSIIAIVLVFSWLCSESAKGSEKPSGSALAEKLTDVPTGKESVSDELPEPPPMRQGNGERIPLQKRVQPIRAKATGRKESTGRSDTAYGYPVVDTFDYSEPSRSRDTGHSGCDYSGSSSDSSSSSCD